MMRRFLCVVVLLVFHFSVAQAKPAPDSFADLADKLIPAVVNISTTQKVTAGGMAGLPEFFPGSPFEEFFKQFFGAPGMPGVPGEEGDEDMFSRRAQSLGSGFIVDASGLVVTNNHVIADAEEVTVILHDDTELPAEILGFDPKTDLALLRVKSKKDLPFVTFGDSDASRVGDWVVAIGNPFGLGGTVTAGIISARARDINAGPYDDFLQTDASINRGNSGGPMFNMNGEVIGINTAIFSPSGGSIGIGFAVPSNLAKPVIAQLKEFGRTKRGWLGVRIQEVTPEIAEGLGMKKTRGALVSEVTPDGPADKAGIKQGDVIVEFDDKPVDEMRLLPRLVAGTDIGKKAQIKVLRQGKMLGLMVVLGELEKAEQAQDKEKEVVEESSPITPRAGVLGLELTEMSPTLRKKYGLAADATGVVILSINRNSVAAEKGLRSGDVIVEAAQQKLDHPKMFADLVEQLRKEGKKSILLLVSRRGDMRFIALRIDEKE